MGQETETTDRCTTTDHGTHVETRWCTKLGSLIATSAPGVAFLTSRVVATGHFAENVFQRVGGGGYFMRYCPFCGATIFHDDPRPRTGVPAPAGGEPLDVKGYYRIELDGNRTVIVDVEGWAALGTEQSGDAPRESAPNRAAAAFDAAVTYGIREIVPPGESPKSALVVAVARQRDRIAALEAVALAARREHLARTAWLASLPAGSCASPPSEALLAAERATQEALRAAT